MAIPSFYCPQLSIELFNSDKSFITLSESESGHAVRSRRLREGQVVNLLNGEGLTGRGKIAVINKRAVEIELDSYDLTPEIVPRLSIATAIPKGDRQKVMVDMLTQLGVSEIIPLDCEHSVTRYSDNLREKWQRAAIESCKQSQNPWLPKIAASRKIGQLIEKKDYCIAYADAGGDNLASITCDGTSSGISSDVISSKADNSSLSNLMVIIGPEGGLSNDEVMILTDQNIQPVSLNTHILRTEAAAITVMAQFIQIYR